MNVSLDDLDASKASDVPFEFEYINHLGVATGIFFSVLGDESEVIRAVKCQMQNERRQKAAAREVTTRLAGNTRKPEFDKFEEDVSYGQKMAAARLVGWRGINDTFTKEGALRLCTSNNHIAVAITAASEAMGNFIKL